jgi:hypothetical protein
MQVTWNAWAGIAGMGPIVAEKRAFNVAQFSHMFKGPGVRAFYMAERVTRQLGDDEDLVPMPPLQFTIFPYEALDEVINIWRSSVPYLDRLEEDGDFKEYQQSLMPTLFPPQAVRP